MRQSFEFMGDTDQWNRSVCVFAGLFAPRLHEYDYNLLFQNVRPSLTTTVEEDIRAILNREHWQDTADEAVYQEAVNWLDRMESRVQSTERWAQCHAAWRRRR